MNNYKNLDISKLNYIIYCRRSSEESEDRQVQSLETQLRELTECAKKNNLNIVDIISESKSAFKIGREGFSRMMSLIKNGKANAVLVVRANRISRNPIDAGYTISLMDEKKLLYIRTPNSTCYTSSSSDKMMIAFELIFSKKDSDDKGDMVREGINSKALKGIPHGVAALGFLNDKTEEKGNRSWMVDEMRLKSIKVLLDMFLTGTYSAGKLHKHAILSLKLTTVKRKRIGGELITPSRIYEILKDPVYAGFFYQGSERYELDEKLPRLITEEEHNKIKMILSKKNIPKVQHHFTTYSGFLRSESGDFIGQDVKYQLICDCKEKFAYRSKSHCPKCGKEIAKLESPKYLGFTYYYNVKKKKSGGNYKVLTESKITKEMITFTDKHLHFSEDLANWSKKYITELKNKEINDRIFLEQKNEADKIEYESKKTRIRAMLRDEQITNEEYKSDLEALNKKYAVGDKKQNGVDWYSQMNEIVDLTLYMSKVFESGTLQAKRNILSKLGSNLVWDDENLFIYNRPAINKLVNGVKLSMEVSPMFEPKINFAVQGLNEKTSEFSPVFSILLRG